MTDDIIDSRLRAKRNAGQFAHFETMKLHLSRAIDHAEHLDDGQRVLGEALAAALDTVGGGAPLYDWFDMTAQDARLWADCAHPLHLEAYCLAGLEALRARRRIVAPKAQRRLMAGLWTELPQDTRAAFLSHVRGAA